MAEAHLFYGVDLGRVMAARILGSNPKVELYVIDLVQGVAIEPPYARIDVREGRVYLYCANGLDRVAIEILKRLQEAVLDPFRKLPPSDKPGTPGQPKKLPPELPKPSGPVKLPPADPDITIDMRKTPEGSWQKK